MASEGAEDTDSPDNDLPLQTAAVADELAATEANHLAMPAALREDQIQNAVSFLSHPKVRGSSKESKSSFLERKGLTAQEIEEAFRRAPQPSTEIVAIPPQSEARPSKPFPAGQSTTLQPVSTTVQVPTQAQPQSLKWTQVVIGASMLAAGAYALKQLVGPYAVGWYRRLYGIEEPSEESRRKEEEKKTADLVAAALQSQTAELRATVESLKDMVGSLAKGKQISSPGVSVSDLRAELHAFATTLTQVASKPDGAEGGLRDEVKELKSILTERLPSTSNSDAAPPASGSAYPFTTGNIGQVPNGSHSVAPPAARFPHKAQESASASSQLPEAPHPPSYMQVLEYLEKGETPPNVRTDINDKPPNPLQPPPNARMQPPLKPWERSQSRSPEPDGMTNTPADNGVTITEIDGSSQGPWKPPPVPSSSLKATQAGPSSSAAEGTDD